MYRKTITIRSRQQAMNVLGNISSITDNVSISEKREVEDRLRSAIQPVTKMASNSALRALSTNIRFEGQSYMITIKIRTRDKRGFFKKIKDLFW